MAASQVVPSASQRSMIAQCARDAFIESHLKETAIVLEQCISQCSQAILAAADLVTECFRSGGKLFICGNGGSAAESQHMAAELTHRLSAKVIRRALPAIALTTDTSFLTACANDDSFDIVFSRQLQALGNSGDVLLGISTSGNSRNVIQAFHQARQLGMQVISLTGVDGAMVDMADIAIAIPSRDTQATQEAHLPVIHLLCALIEAPFAAK